MSNEQLIEYIEWMKSCAEISKMDSKTLAERTMCSGMILAYNAVLEQLISEPINSEQ